MDFVVQQITSGLAEGAIYASVALALVMIFTATEHLNFAQGEMAMFSTYIAWTLINAGVPYWIAFVITVLVSFVGGVAIQFAVLRPLARAPVLAYVIVFIGLLVIFNSMAGWIWSYVLKEFPSPFKAFSTGSTLIGSHQLGVIAVTLIVLTALYLFFRFTPLGLAMRAAAQNPISAKLVGVRVGWMLALGWGLAAGIGAIAGMMVAPIVFLDPNMMAGILLYGFASALLGGISNPAGAVLGGFIFGVLQNVPTIVERWLGTNVIGNELKLTFALVVVVAVLTFKPSGLFGQVRIKRV
ncbi:MAG: branched-chain amino acid ABC transporter permease [Rhodospirillales bacterium]